MSVDILHCQKPEECHDRPLYMKFKRQNCLVRKVCSLPHHAVFVPILIQSHNPAKFPQVLLTLLGEMELTEDKYIFKTREMALY